MAQVKPTPEYPLAVVPHRPGYSFLKAILIITAIILMIVGSYYSGLFRASSIEQVAVLELDKLRLLQIEKELTIKELEQQVANLKLGAIVDRKATEQVRSQVVELENQIADLERNNSLYRDLVGSSSDETGISMEVPTIKPLSGNNSFEYQMVVKQLDAKKLQVGGYLEFVVVGTLEGDAKRIPLKLLSDSVDEDKIKLNFRYFQRIEGEMELPEGFLPKGIELKLVSVRPKKALIEKKFTWSVEES